MALKGSLDKPVSIVEEVAINYLRSDVLLIKDMVLGLRFNQLWCDWTKLKHISKYGSLLKGAEILEGG
jgi:hypothetical protein